MQRCMGCKTKGTFWCSSCDQEYYNTRKEVASMTWQLGENYSEGKLVLSAHELLESERLIEMTSLGKAAWTQRAYELLLEVDDHFTNTPMCPACKLHKLELQVGEPLKVNCLGGCEL